MKREHAVPMPALATYAGGHPITAAAPVRQDAEGWVRFAHRLFVLAASFGMTTAAPGQVSEAWVARYDGGAGDDGASSLAVDSAGNVYVTGTSGVGDQGDYATLKYDADGHEMWARLYSGPGNNGDGAGALVVDASGNVYVTGSSYGAATTGWSLDWATIKYDGNGSQLWVSRYNGPGSSFDGAGGLAVDAAGNVYVAGGSEAGTGYSTNDFATIKYDASGNPLWVRRYNGPGNGADLAGPVALDPMANVFVTGVSYGGPGTDDDIATIKYDTNGNQVWLARFSGSGSFSDFPAALAVDGAGNVYVAGSSETGTSYSTRDYITIKYNADGNQLWAARYNGPANQMDFLHGMAIDAFGLVYVTGDSVGAGTSDDYVTIKYDSNGNQLWLARFDGPVHAQDAGGAVRVDSSGHVYVTGWSQTIQFGNPDYVTIKYDASGQQLWLARYDGPAGGDDRPSDLVLGAAGSVYVTGGASGIGTAHDYTTVKYTQSPPACYPDCNADGSLTVADFGCFQTRFVAADPWADCNTDGALTVADFGCFQTKFVAGCP